MNNLYTRRTGIRRFIALWIGAVLLSFALLAFGLLYAVPRLNAKTARIFFDSQSLDTSQKFELALFFQAREDALWRSNGSARHEQARRQWLAEADTELAALQKQADTPEEKVLFTAIVRDYAPVRRMAFTAQSDSRPMRQATDQLLVLVGQSRDLNARQMTQTMLASQQLDVLIDRWIIGLTLLASALLLSGSLMLWRRLFTPLLRLARVVRQLGAGDLQARAPVTRDDEMGDLCSTFNVMAGAIGERERERLQFVATVAHDLRNPLVVIGGAAHLLKHKEMRLSPEERGVWLGNIEKNAQKLEAMIGDLTDGVQAETGQLAFDLKPLDLAALARELTEDHAGATDTHLIRFEDDGPCPVCGDRKRLERVLANLLSNAVKYSERGREVDVQLTKHGASAVLTVRDEGAGIAPDDLPKLFLPFSRLERTKKMASGTGLGLCSAKKIIEGQGGTIALRSTLGVGTTVEVRLPLLSSK